MKTNIDIVILCGGSGTRLWPVSRSAFPKQFSNVIGNSSLFKKTLSRLKLINSSDYKVGNLIMITNEDHRFMVLEQSSEYDFANNKIILEPAARNTAPALTLAALESYKSSKDSILVVGPSDHIFSNENSFLESLKKAIEFAQSNHVVTLGIEPTEPNTGYGYIKSELNEVHQFIEKPDFKMAEELIKDKSYFWNSGLFILKSSKWLELVDEFLPETYKKVSASWSKKTIDASFIRPDKEIFLSVDSESIDYGVIEKAIKYKSLLKMIPLINSGWNDLGAWDAVWKASEKDNNKNSLRGDVLAIDTKKSLIYSHNRLITVLGMDEVVIVDSDDALLVTTKENANNLKTLTSKLADQNREELIFHKKVFRPWGWFKTIEEGHNFKVKVISVNPGAKLSLQKHAHRAENWVITKGIAEVTLGKKNHILKINESIYIPLGSIHSLANNTKEPLEIIEVQSGSYLGEDDIIRIDDIYGRA